MNCMLFQIQFYISLFDQSEMDAWQTDTTIKSLQIPNGSPCYYRASFQFHTPLFPCDRRAFLNVVPCPFTIDDDDEINPKNKVKHSAHFCHFFKQLKTWVTEILSSWAADLKRTKFSWIKGESVRSCVVRSANVCLSVHSSIPSQSLAMRQPAFFSCQSL